MLLSFADKFGSESFSDAVLVFKLASASSDEPVKDAPAQKKKKQKTQQDTIQLSSTPVHLILLSKCEFFNAQVQL